jgi:hypothetical protein
MFKYFVVFLIIFSFNVQASEYDDEIAVKNGYLIVNLKHPKNDLLNFIARLEDIKTVSRSKGEASNDVVYNITISLNTENEYSRSNRDYELRFYNLARSSQAYSTIISAIISQGS